MMDEKKEPIREMREKMKKAEKVVSFGVVALLVVGCMILLYAAFASVAYINIMTDDHMTDDGIAYRDLENATYTWSGSEITEMMEDNTWVMAIGAALAGMGYVAMLVMAALIPSDTKSHAIYCKQWETPEDPDEAKFKYCPECGLKLSRLEKK